MGFDMGGNFIGGNFFWGNLKEVLLYGGNCISGKIWKKVDGGGTVQGGIDLEPDYLPNFNMTKKKQILVCWKKSNNDFICNRYEMTSENRLM